MICYNFVVGDNMKTIEISESEKKPEKIDEVVIRTKALLINDTDEILLGYANGVYQFPGGHLREGETIEECLKRELKEETGMEIDTVNLKPFLKLAHNYENYNDSGLNRRNEIYYYFIKSDLKYNLNETNYDDYEKLYQYKLKRFPLNDIKHVLIDNVDKNPINKYIVEEMLIALNEYDNFFGSSK